MSLRFVSLALAVALVAPAAAVAQSTTTAVPKCSSGDPVVLVDTKAKTYQMMPKTTSTTTGSAVKSPSGTVKPMCLSKAQAMGAKSVPDSSNTQPMSRSGGSSSMNGNGNMGTNGPGSSGGAGPYTAPSPAPAGTNNAGNPPAGPPSHSP